MRRVNPQGQQKIAAERGMTVDMADGMLHKSRMKGRNKGGAMSEMVRVAIIDPLVREVSYKEVPDGIAVSQAAGHTETDHGVVEMTGRGSGHGIFVYEYGLMSSAPEYFSLNGHLYHGRSVLYAYDSAGRTVSIKDSHPKPTWLGGIDEVEAAISNGTVERPVASVNGEIYWRWPAPSGEAEARE